MISHGSGGLPLLTLAKPEQKQTGEVFKHLFLLPT